MNKGICLSGIVILVLAVGILFGTRYTQLYAEVYVDQMDLSAREYDFSLGPVYIIQRTFDERFPTTERDTAFLDQKIVEVMALYPKPLYQVDGGGWEEETIYPYAIVSGIVCLIGFVTVAISFAIHQSPIKMRKKDKVLNSPSEILESKDSANS